ncbi:MAG: nucleotidyltransferase [Acidobacteria bacterium]|jgi:predicted nucleotidyltransferase|nr:nucleotidyltransferase [Acidobacteriota bacterium]
MFAEILANLADNLNRKNLGYMVIGGQAVLVHGEPRLTKDIDVTVAAGLEKLDLLVEVAEASGLEPLVDPEEFTTRTMVLPCLHKPSGVRVDFILSFSPYEREAIDRAAEIEVAGSKVRFASAEDLIVHKVLAGRPRDLEDVRSVLLKNPKLDQRLVSEVLSDLQESLDLGSTLVDRFTGIVNGLGREQG